MLLDALQVLGVKEKTDADSDDDRAVKSGETCDEIKSKGFAGCGCAHLCTSLRCLAATAQL